MEPKLKILINTDLLVIWQKVLIGKRPVIKKPHLFIDEAF
jgi:hypothetical protein